MEVPAVVAGPGDRMGGERVENLAVNLSGDSQEPVGVADVIAGNVVAPGSETETPQHSDAPGIGRNDDQSSRQPSSEAILERVPHIAPLE